MMALGVSDNILQRWPCQLVSHPTCSYSVIVDALPWRDRVYTPYS